MIIFCVVELCNTICGVLSIKTPVLNLLGGQKIPFFCLEFSNSKNKYLLTSVLQLDITFVACNVTKTVSNGSIENHLNGIQGNLIPFPFMCFLEVKGKGKSEHGM